MYACVCVCMCVGVRTLVNFWMGNVLPSAHKDGTAAHLDERMHGSDESANASRRREHTGARILAGKGCLYIVLCD